MSGDINLRYLGLKPYREVLEIQELSFNRLLDEKMKKSTSFSEMDLILCQHLPVYTLGKNGDEQNLLNGLKVTDAEFVHTNRGGDITFHGPGQLVGYPILDLERLNIGLARYIELLEESIIRTIAHFGLKGERYKGASGVWLDTDDSLNIRKICALGIRSSRWITMHGFAFNINTDLKYFNYINPCGFTDKGVTSLEKELGRAQDFEHVRSLFTMEFLDVFNLSTTSISNEKAKIS